MPRLTYLKISNFKGFEAFEVEFDEGVCRIKGPNEAGKSSIIEAIRAAFVGAGPEVLRDGKGPAEIIVHTEALKIRRRITHRATNIEVRDKDTNAIRPKPASLLRQLADVLAFRPLDLLAASDQVAKVAETLNLTLAASDLDQALDALGFISDEKEQERTRLLRMKAIEALRYVQTQLVHKRRDVGRAARKLEPQIEALRGKVTTAFEVADVERKQQELSLKIADAEQALIAAQRADVTRDSIRRLDAELTETRRKRDALPEDEEIYSEAEDWHELEVARVGAEYDEEQDRIKLKQAQLEEEAKALQEKIRAKAEELEMVEARKKERRVALAEEKDRRAKDQIAQRDRWAGSMKKKIAAIEETIEDQRATIAEAQDPSDLESEIARLRASQEALRADLAQAHLNQELVGKIATLADHRREFDALTGTLEHYRSEPGRLLRATGIPVEKLDVSEDGRELVFANEEGKLLPMNQHAASRRLRVVIEVLCHRIQNRKLRLLCVDGVEIVDENERPKLFEYLAEKQAAGFHVFVTEATVDPEGATIALTKEDEDDGSILSEE